MPPRDPTVLLIRADASVAVGVGHVMRCLALAQEWKRSAGACGGKGRAVMAGVEFPAGLKSRVENEGIEIRPVREVPGSAEDAGQLTELGREINAGVMVLDGYHFSRDYQARVRVFGAFPVMVLDDYAEIGGHDADLILDQNYGADVSLYGTSSRVGRFLLGTDYVLLRREFRLRRKTPRDVADRAGKILIAMGGSDPDNLSGKVIEVLRGLLDDGATFKVVAGPACPHLDVLRKRSGESAGRIDLIADSNDMPDLLAWADLVILAGGGTLWEALCMGCPVVSLARHPVQDVILGKMGKAGIIAYAGFAASLEMKAFQGEIIELVASRPRRAEMSRKGQQLIDGEGTSRVVRALFDMVSSKKTN